MKSTTSKSPTSFPSASYVPISINELVCDVYQKAVLQHGCCQPKQHHLLRPAKVLGATSNMASIGGKVEHEQYFDLLEEKHQKPRKENGGKGEPIRSSCCNVQNDTAIQENEAAAQGEEFEAAKKEKMKKGNVTTKPSAVPNVPSIQQQLELIDKGEHQRRHPVIRNINELVHSIYDHTAATTVGSKGEHMLSSGVNGAVSTMASIRAPIEENQRQPKNHHNTSSSSLHSATVEERYTANVQQKKKVLKLEKKVAEVKKKRAEEHGIRTGAPVVTPSEHLWRHKDFFPLTTCVEGDDNKNNDAEKEQQQKKITTCNPRLYNSAMVNRPFTPAPRIDRTVLTSKHFLAKCSPEVRDAMGYDEIEMAKRPPPHFTGQSAKRMHDDELETRKRHLVAITRTMTHEPPTITEANAQRMCGEELERREIRRQNVLKEFVRKHDIANGKYEKSLRRASTADLLSTRDERNKNAKHVWEKSEQLYRQNGYQHHRELVTKYAHDYHPLVNMYCKTIPEDELVEKFESLAAKRRRR